MSGYSNSKDIIARLRGTMRRIGAITIMERDPIWEMIQAMGADDYMDPGKPAKDARSCNNCKSLAVLAVPSPGRVLVCNEYHIELHSDILANDLFCDDWQKKDNARKGDQ